MAWKTHYEFDNSIRISSQALQDPGAVQKLEAQAWISLYNLLSKRQSAEKYEISEYRKGRILKVLPLINNDIENQLSFLVSFKKWLLQLELGAAAPAKSTGLLIEAVAEIRDGLITRFGR